MASSTVQQFHSMQRPFFQWLHNLFKEINDAGSFKALGKWVWLAAIDARSKLCKRLSSKPNNAYSSSAAFFGIGSTPGASFSLNSRLTLAARNEMRFCLRFTTPTHHELNRIMSTSQLSLRADPKGQKGHHLFSNGLIETRTENALNIFFPKIRVAIQQAGRSSLNRKGSDTVGLQVLIKIPRKLTGRDTESIFTNGRLEKIFQEVLKRLGCILSAFE